MESTTQNNTTNTAQAPASAFPTPGQTAFPTPGQAAPTYPTPNQTAAKTPVTFATPAPAPVQAPAPAPTQAAQPAAQPAPAPAVNQPAPAQAPQSAPQPTPEETPAEEEEGTEKKKKHKKLILNTQRILDDWKFERGKVLIFFMKLIRHLAAFFAVCLYIGGFVHLIGANIAIGFWEPIAQIPNITTTAPLMLLGATFLAVWVSFANKLTPYFKAFSLAKWLDKHSINPNEVAKIFLQERQTKAITKYNKGRGGISAEKADLSQATFTSLNEEYKALYKSEFISALLFWIFISLLQLAFIYFFSVVVALICQQIQMFIGMVMPFDINLIFNILLNPIFIAVVICWIIIGVAGGITVACISHKKKKNLQEWLKAEMKDFLPTEEYYEE